MEVAGLPGTGRDKQVGLRNDSFGIAEYPDLSLSHTGRTGGKEEREGGREGGRGRERKGPEQSFGGNTTPVNRLLLGSQCWRGIRWKINGVSLAPILNGNCRWDLSEGTASFRV